MKPYGEREPRIVAERHGCTCCFSYKDIKKPHRKPSKTKERRRGKKKCRELEE